MPHMARSWLDQHRNDPGRLLLDTDESNAHNEVDRHTFLLRMRQVAPGIARWLEYIYPTDCATMVFYRGRILDSKAGGQQGCPLMQVCHAMVQRILLEAIGIIPIDPATTPVASVLHPPARLDIIPMFADDAIIAGVATEVLRTLSHWKPLVSFLATSSSTAGPLARCSRSGRGRSRCRRASHRQWT